MKGPAGPARRAPVQIALLLAAVLLTCSGVLGQAQLQLQGEPWFDGQMSLHVTAADDVGEPAWVILGLDPLPLHAPVNTSAGPWYLGSILEIHFLGFIPATGRLDVSFTMPSLVPGAEGAHLPVQAWVADRVSNPATVPLDLPYYQPGDVTVIPHPVPSEQALFGDSVASGDFNNDGHVDLAVGAWFEDVNGIDKAGRCYVLWGPDFSHFAMLESAAPAYRTEFGGGLAVADFDDDGIDDLAVREGTGGDPPNPSAHGHVHIFRGGRTLETTPWMTINSTGMGQEGALFGRLMRAGDINGDGLPDLVVCAPDSTVQGLTRAGRLEVFTAPAYGPAQLIENPEPKTDDFFGSRVSLGDVNGDGIVDIVEASGRAAVGQVAQGGRVHVFDGPSLQLLATIDNPAPAANDRFGEGLWAADLDGDARAEVIAADVKKNFYVVWDALGGASTSAWSKPPTPNPTAASTSFGYFFTVVDPNQDGRPDIIIADPFEGDAVGCGPLSAGGTLYFAIAPYFSTYARLVNPVGACGDEFSWNLVASQVEGDERLELIAGDDTADVGGVLNSG